MHFSLLTYIVAATLTASITCEYFCRNHDKYLAHLRRIGTKKARLHGFFVQTVGTISFYILLDLFIGSSDLRRNACFIPILIFGLYELWRVYKVRAGIRLEQNASSPKQINELQTSPSNR
ncbi:MAG TPA: hypothetical protein V6C76_14245 [Drouetiella sp.]